MVEWMGVVGRRTRLRVRYPIARGQSGGIWWTALWFWDRQWICINNDRVSLLDNHTMRTMDNRNHAKELCKGPVTTPRLSGSLRSPLQSLSFDLSLIRTAVVSADQRRSEQHESIGTRHT
jgi:hypothetical protein